MNRTSQYPSIPSKTALSGDSLESQELFPMIRFNFDSSFIYMIVSGYNDISR